MTLAFFKEKMSKIMVKKERSRKVGGTFTNTVFKDCPTFSYSYLEVLQPLLSRNDCTCLSQLVNQVMGKYTDRTRYRNTFHTPKTLHSANEMTNL